MQRDMDLFRAILLSIEEEPVGSHWTAKPLLDHSVQSVVAHLRLIDDDGLVEARFVGPMTNDTAFVLRMTNAGYDFLEASRQPTRWEQARKVIIAQSLPMTIGVIKDVLESLIRPHLPH